jgi:hypothetical protein
MARYGLIGKSLALLSAAACLASCGIRLPDTPALTYRQPVVHKTAPSPDGKTPDVIVWMIADELHTGMVFPYEWLLDSGFIPPAGFGKPQYVSLSWGNRTAYVEKGLHSPGKFVQAMFTASP